MKLLGLDSFWFLFLNFPMASGKAQNCRTQIAHQKHHSENVLESSLIPSFILSTQSRFLGHVVPVTLNL